jgi:hypothetical protein
MATNGADLVANDLLNSLAPGPEFEVPNIDITQDEFQFPGSLGDDLYGTVTRLKNEDLTTGAVGGTGAFDALMQSIKAHLREEYDKGRITGAEYTKAYIALTEGAMANATQFLLSREQAFWEAQKSQIAAISGLTELELQKLRITQARLEAVTTRVNFARAKISLALEDLNFGTAKFNLDQILPKELELKGLQGLSITSQTNLTDKQLDRLDSEISLTEAQVSKMAVEETLVTQQVAKLVKDTDYIVAQTGQIESQIELTEAQTLKLGSDKSLVDAEVLKNAQELQVLIKQVTKLDSEIELTDAQIAKMESDTAVNTAQIAKLASDRLYVDAQATKIPSEILLTDAQTAKLGSDKLYVDAQITKVASEKSLIDSQVAKAAAEKLNIEANTNRITAEITLLGSQNQKMLSDKLLVDAQRTNLGAEKLKIEADTQFILSRVTLNENEIDLFEIKEKLMQEQLEGERAKTMDTRSDGITPILGSVGKQKDLYAQQIVSYQRDAEVKAGKLFVDSWITQKTIDEGLLAPQGFTNASLDQVLSALKIKNGFVP